MPQLKPLNPATCPYCAKKETRRIGYSAERKGSLWKCVAEGCGKPFLVPTLSLVRKMG